MTDPQNRMEEIYKDNPRIGRCKLEQLAQVRQIDAREFLRGKRPTAEESKGVATQTLIVGLHDWHIPYHDEKALSCAFAFCERVQPKIIILHECHDFYPLSRFNKDPARNDLQYEIDLTNEKLKDLRKRCPKSKMILLKSNHTDRLQRYLWSEAKALSSLKAMKVEQLLGLAELEIEYRPNFVYKHFLWKHGSIVRQDSAYTAKAEFIREGMSGTSGHTHRLGAHYRTVRGGSYVWIEGGCLCDLQPEYMHDDVANWQHGISTVQFEKEGNQFIAMPIPIIDGSMLWGGEMIKG